MISREEAVWTITHRYMDDEARRGNDDRRAAHARATAILTALGVGSEEIPPLTNPQPWSKGMWDGPPPPAWMPTWMTTERPKKGANNER